MVKIVRVQRLMRKTAHNLVVDMAQYGNHTAPRAPRTVAEVKRIFNANGIDFDDLVERCRNGDTVPYYENLITTQTFHSVGGATIQALDAAGNVIAETNGPGSVTRNVYQAQFDSALAALKRGMPEVSQVEIVAAVTSGITSIDSYISYRAHTWNTLHPTQLLLDDSTAKVSRESKIDKWIPIMTNGKKLDKSNRMWAEYKRLRDLRDDGFIHIKTPAIGGTYQDLCDIVNAFRTGVAGMLFELHKLFNDRVPSSIIREFHAAEAIIIDEDIINNG